ncbi:MAG: MarR family transcriptional regulator [Firmicutes bacterium]|nr:MarR family transcriptional regulator [Bacillota bacterium]
MEKGYLDSLAKNLFSILPLFKKKLIKPEENMKNLLDLSPSHIQILFFLESEGKHSISEIGEKLYISKSNMTPLINKLIDNNLAERIRDENDRRYVNIGITNKGKRLTESHRTLVANNLKDRLQGLSKKDLKELSKSIESVKNIISKLD